MLKKIIKNSLKAINYVMYLHNVIYKKHNVFTEKADKNALSANDDKRILSIDSIETYKYGTNKDLICKKQETKYNNILKQCKK